MFKITEVSNIPLATYTSSPIQNPVFLQPTHSKCVYAEVPAQVIILEGGMIHAEVPA
jgi:hypothetical protein